MTLVIIFTKEQEEEISFSHSLYEASVPENSAAGGSQIPLTVLAAAGLSPLYLGW